MERCLNHRCLEHSDNIEANGCTEFGDLKDCDCAIIAKKDPSATSPAAMAGCVPDLRKCAVTDMNKNHCQNEPEHFVELKSGKVVELCGNCYIAWTHKCFEK